MRPTPARQKMRLLPSNALKCLIEHVWLVETEQAVEVLQSFTRLLEGYGMKMHARCPG